MLPIYNTSNLVFANKVFDVFRKKKSFFYVYIRLLIINYNNNNLLVIIVIKYNVIKL